KEIPFNIKLLLDGEEEKGSAPLARAVDRYRELLQADFLMIVDGPLHSSGAPTLVYGCRGITSLELTVHGAQRPLHSGHYGNYAPNPGFQLAQLLAGMKDVDGRVSIPGYYDGIELDSTALAMLGSVPDKAGEIGEQLQIGTPEKVGGSLQESLQYPSLNIRGLQSAWVGEGARTIIPATATASLDLRLVMETDGDHLKNLVRDHIEKQGFTILDHVPSKEERMAHDKIVTLQLGGVTPAFRTDPNNPYGKFLLQSLCSTF